MVKNAMINVRVTCLSCDAGSEGEKEGDWGREREVGRRGEVEKKMGRGEMGERRQHKSIGESNSGKLV